MFIKEIGITREVATRYNKEIGRVGCVYPNDIEEEGGGSYYIHSNLGACNCVEVSDGRHFYYEI